MELIGQGVTLMAVGMLVVFAFLALLVAAMQVSAVFFRAFAHLFPEPQPAPTRSLAAASGMDAEVAVAIAAVRAFTD